MRTASGTCWILVNVLVLGLLAAAQTGAVSHAYEHDLGAPTEQACAGCAVAAQLPAAGPDYCGIHADRSTACRDCSYRRLSVTPVIHLPARQRGPPIAS